MIRKRSLLLAFAAAGVLALGAVFVVAAQTPTPTPAGDRADRFIEKLAGKLGVTPDELKNAAKQSATEIVDEKLAAGEITQQRADAARRRIANSDGLNFGFGKHGRPGVVRRAVLGTARAVADAIGIDVKTLLSEAKAGNKSFAQVAEDHGKTRDQVKTDALAAISAQLDEQVAAGRITAEQKQAMLDRAANGIDRMLDAAPGDHGRHRFRPGPAPTPTPQ